MLTERPLLALMTFLVFTTGILVSGTVFVVRSGGYIEPTQGAVYLPSDDSGGFDALAALPPAKRGTSQGGHVLPLKIRRHRVEAGENLWIVARQHGLDMKTIIGCNEGLSEEGALQPGNDLLIPNQKGVFYRLKFGQTLSDLSWAYNVRLEAIFRANSITNAGKIKSGDNIFIPGAEPLELGSKRLKRLEKAVIDTTFDKPVRGRLTRGYGWRIHPIRKRREFHRGIDLGVYWGCKVKAAQDGKVVFAGWKGGYGHFVRIKHRFGYETRYGHLTSPLDVKKGDKVKRGQVIGRTGTTGTSTGSHLHFEIYRDGRSVNPLRYVRP